MSTELNTPLAAPEVTGPRKFTVTPERIGRHRDVESFEVNIGSHFIPTADMVANAIARHVKPFLVSKGGVVNVNLPKGTFSIQGGRWGRGTVTEVF